MHNLQLMQRTRNNRTKINSWNTFNWDSNKVKDANRILKIWEFQTLKLILIVENKVEISLRESRLQEIQEIYLRLEL